MRTSQPRQCGSADLALDEPLLFPRIAQAQIPFERGVWFLDSYRALETRLVFGGKVLGEMAVCAAKLTRVCHGNHAMVEIKLFSGDEKECWDRQISLRHATFFLFQLGDAGFERFSTSRIHSLLVVGFPDGTTMYLAELTE
jgi:hypothetical protein